MEPNPLDLEKHEKESTWGVWKRRLMFGLIIVLCITFAAPTFGSCAGVLGGEAAQPEGTWQLDGEEQSVSRARFGDVQKRLIYTYNILAPQIGMQAPDGRDWVWTHILMNAAAEAEGIHVSDARVAEMIRENPYFQVDGKYDERGYRRVLQQRTRGELSHRDFVRTVREILRSEEYRRLYQTALQLVPSRKAFERWQERNEKVSVEYVAQGFAPLREQADADLPDDATLQEWLSKNRAVEERLQLPARRTIEVLYARVRDIDEEQATAARKLLEEQGVIDSDADGLDRLAVQLYYGDKDVTYTRKNWLARERPKYELALKVWEEAGADPEQKPPSPEAEQWPESPLEQYHRFWKDEVRKEALAREVARIAARRAASEGVSLDSIAPDYEQYGLRYARNEEPLTLEDMAAEFPADLAVDSELVDIVRTSFKGPVGDAPFLPDVHDAPVPTTRIATALDRRGYMVLRFAGFEPPRPPEFAEIRDDVLEAYQKDRVTRMARERLIAVREAVEGGQSFEEAAQTAGLELAHLRRFNRGTPERRVPLIPADEPEDSELRVVADRIRRRNRVLQDYSRLSTLASGEFRIMIDPASEAGYLMRVTEKHQPTEMEIPERELETQRLLMLRESLQEQVALVQYEEVARRFQLRLNPLPGTEEEDDAGKQTGQQPE